VKDAEYTQTQERLLLLVPFVVSLDLEGFLERINECESIAPIINPTLYMQGRDKLDEVTGLARALLSAQRGIRKLIGDERYEKMRQCEIKAKSKTMNPNERRLAEKTTGLLKLNTRRLV
jgi:hypothetical protein